MGLLDGEIAEIIGSELDFVFLDATLERDVAGAATDPADPSTPTTASYACRAIVDKFSTGLMSAGLVAGGDVQILILATSLSTSPLPLDRITVVGYDTYSVVPADSSGRRAVESDPARATWSCRCTL